MQRIRLLVLLLLCVVCQQTFAQQRILSGLVISAEDHEPLIGATISVQGNEAHGVVTDIDGKYTLEVGPDDKILVVAYLGMKTQLIKVPKKEHLNVVLQPETMNLEEVLDVMKRGVAAGKKVVRVHTGDPSIYGAHREQMVELEKLGISYEIVPGVSSFLAAAASLKREYTLPGVSQTVILTRMEGRTAVPEREQIEALAAHQATMVIFLSVGEIETLSTRLQAGGYPEDTPAAVVYKASWEDQKIVKGTLTDIAQKVKEAGIRKTALVTVGRFLGDTFELSRLYDAHFTTEFRKGV